MRRVCGFRADPEHLLLFLRLASGRLFTLGRYPTHARPDGSRTDSYVCCVGLVVFCLLLLVLCGQF